MTEPDIQAVPRIGAGDVDRLVTREFPMDHAETVRELLATYAGPEAHRVRAAVLKLASGSLERLRRALATATTDYRDVIAPAEYPEYLRHSYAEIRALAAAEVEAIRARDWRQYREWFDKP